jgi:signal peptidase II
MKGRNVTLLILAIVLADQALKIYIKTHYYINEHHNVLGEWFRLHFVENEGMAYGWKFGGDWGKMILTLFRLGAVIFGVYYIRDIIRKKYNRGFIICAGLVFAGALGNLIDSMFYGLIFNESIPGSMAVAQLFPEHGYAGFLHGKVVDMLYFPIIRDAHFPQWVPLWAVKTLNFSVLFSISLMLLSLPVLSLSLFFKNVFLSTTTKNKTTQWRPMPW